MAQATGDTKKIHTVLANMLQLWPNDSAVQNDEAYLRLLLLAENGSASNAGDQRSEVNEIEAVAEKLVQRNPASMPHRTLLALARLRQNRPPDALVVYTNIQVTPRALTPSALAVHAAVLAANSQTDDAAAEAAQVRLDRLLPEERALIENLRQ
jgi:hypothetical protein